MQRSVPERVRDFLAQRLGRMYCDACIQERLGLKWRQQVQLVTSTLACTTDFDREQDLCCTCNETKHVIFAVKVPSEQKKLPRILETGSIIPKG